MKHFSCLFSKKKEYKETLKEIKSNSYNSLLIQLFTALTNKQKIEKILLKLQNDFPDAIIIGATTAGEISQAIMYEKSSVVSFTLFDETKLHVKYVKDINKKSAKKLSLSLNAASAKAAIVLSEGLYGENYESFVEEIHKSNPKMIVAGGLAGDNFQLKKTYIFHQTKLYKRGAIAVSFSGKNLFANNDYNLNWVPIGKEFIVTDVEKNKLNALDHKSAVEVFEHYLGKEIFANDASELSNFQLLYTEGSTLVSRTPLKSDGKSLILAGPIKKGQRVQFGFSNRSNLIKGSWDMSKSIKDKPADAIYIYSCIARKTLLGKELENEFAQFQNIAPTAGFFTYGEFYSSKEHNSLLNCTTTILLLSEGKKSLSKRKLSNKRVTNHEDSTFNALSHFIEQTSKELQNKSKLLSEYKDAVDAYSLVSKTDAKGNITYVNDNFCRVSKYKRHEMIGKNHNIVRDQKVPDALFRKMWKTLLTGKIWRGILSNRAKDGSIYYVYATIMPIKDEKGFTQEYIAIRQDVTKEIESKQRLKEKEKLIKAIFDNQDSIVLLSSKTQGMLNVNKKLFEYLDFKDFKDFKSQHECICNLFIEEEGYIYPSKYPNWIDDAVDSQSNSHKKAKIKTKDGVVRTFSIMAKKINDAYIINLYDITELENALLKAHASEQAKSIFLANMSHEIRTPLNGILGFTDILTKKELDSDIKKYIDIIHSSGNTLLNIVNDILDFSKIESGELTLYETESDLFKEMEATVTTFSSLCKQKSLNCYIYIDTKIPKTLYCDIQRIKQVMNNLVSNAIKFTPQSNDIHIKIELSSIQNSVATINFSVKDSGIGIAKDKIKTIFQAFSQADNSISREYGGTGLGLSISSQYIKMMDSKLKVSSEPNRGSDFYFSLNLPIINESLSIKKRKKKSKSTITILNDDKENAPAIHKIITTYLKSWGYSYRTINTLKDSDNTTEILIIPAKLLSQKDCEQTILDYKKIELIYIEDSKEKLDCSSERFHFIEQPLIASSLFDTLITITENKKQKLETLKTELPQYSGNILIAEDNETNQMLISLLLQERGLTYTIVNNGQEAVDILQEGEAHYDIVFMDINMPILDGIAATKILREYRYTKPIISLSANVIESDIKSFRDAGVDDTLHKPLDPKKLDKLLKKYLHTKKEPLENLQYDKVDIEKLSKILSISDITLVYKLLESFLSSITAIIEELEEKAIESETVHKIKGLAGNFRFKRLYSITVDYEEYQSRGDKSMDNKLQEKLILHMKQLVKEIQKKLPNN